MRTHTHTHTHKITSASPQIWMLLTSDWDPTPPTTHIPSWEFGRRRTCTWTMQNNTCRCTWAPDCTCMKGLWQNEEEKDAEGERDKVRMKQTIHTRVLIETPRTHTYTPPHRCDQLRPQGNPPLATMVQCEGERYGKGLYPSCIAGPSPGNRPSCQWSGM